MRILASIFGYSVQLQNPKIVIPSLNGFVVRFCQPGGVVEKVIYARAGISRWRSGAAGRLENFWATVFKNTIEFFFRTKSGRN